MTLSLIVGMIFFGVLLILIEIFVTPGFVVGVVGALFLFIGIAYTYNEFGALFGNITLGITGAFLGTTIVMAFRKGAWKRFALTDVIEGKANNIHELRIDVGDVGITVSALRPAGTAIINEQRAEVHADGEFILANEQIVVIKKNHNRIYIKKLKS